jgi:O-antigen/teichoic acid export membrane protein
MSLKKQAISGVKWTSLSSILVAVIQLIQLAVLAHYLNASDFGLMAIVSVIIGFSALFMDMGISASIIHKQDITHIQLSSLYWLNIAAGLLLFILVYLSAPYVAAFYNESELVPLVRLLALTFVLSAVGNQYAILLQKSLRFALIAKINILSVFGAFILSVLLAANGFGVYALVYGTISNIVVSTLLNVLIGIKEHRPALCYSHTEIRPMISFGMYQMGERAINYFNSQFDVILIGKLLGTEALGIYSIAKNLAMRPAMIINPVITRVAFPVMAKVQDDIPRLKGIYLRTINYLSSINFPIYLLIALLAEPIIYLFFSEKWEGSIVILQILALYYAIRSTGNPVGSLQLARGRADLGFYWNLGIFFVTPVILYIGSRWGLEGTAYSLLFSGIFLTVQGWYFLVLPLCEAGFTEYFTQILRPLCITVVSGMVAYGTKSMLAFENLWGVSLSVVFVMGVSVIVLNLLFNRPFMEMLYEMIERRHR